MFDTLIAAAEPDQPFDYDAASAIYRGEHRALTNRIGAALVSVANSPARAVTGVGLVFRRMK